MSEIDSMFNAMELPEVPITYKELAEIFRVMLNKQVDLYDTQSKSINALDDIIKYCIDETEYRRRRDVGFFISILDSLSLVDKEKMRKAYNEWCDEYDELNREHKNEKNQ